MKVILNNCIVYKASPFEKFASRFFPHYIPFISKRKRVKIRNYFKHRYKRRLMNDLVSQLKEIHMDKIPGTVETDWTDWEWEVECTRYNSKIHE